MEEDPHLNIDDLYESKKKRDLTRMSIYIKLLKRIHSEIKISSQDPDNEQVCYFVMPEFLIGDPAYDFTECLTYLIDRLTIDGFVTRYVHPNLLMICWSHWVPTYVCDEIKKKTGKEFDHYGIEKIEKPPTVKFETGPKSIKSGGSSVYDDEFINSMKSFKF